MAHVPPVASVERASVCPADVGGAYTRPTECSDPGGPFFDPEPESRGSLGGCIEQARVAGLAVPFEAGDGMDSQ